MCCVIFNDAYCEREGNDGFAGSDTGFLSKHSPTNNGIEFSFLIFVFTTKTIHFTLKFIDASSLLGNQHVTNITAISVRISLEGECGAL